MFNWHDFLTFAKTTAATRFQSDKDKETAFRVAISRAYYAALHVTKNYIEERYRTFDEDRSVHVEVINFLWSQPSGPYQDIARTLDGMRRQRNLVDYDPRWPADKAAEYLVNLVIRDSERIVAYFEKSKTATP